MASFSDQLIALQHLINRLLPSTADADTPACLATALYRACQVSVGSLLPPEKAKDEIWSLLRSSSVSPSLSQIDDIYQRLTQIHHQTLRTLGNTSLKKDDTRLSAWNNQAATLYEQMALTSGVGSRVYDPRNTNLPPPQAGPSGGASSSSGQTATGFSTASSSTAASSQRPASSSNSSRKNRSAFDASWLRERCAQLSECKSGAATPHEMAMSVLLPLCDNSLTDEHLQGNLYDMFVGDFDAVADVLQKRATIAKNRDSVQADIEQAREIFENGSANVNSSFQAQLQQPRSRKAAGRRQFGRNQKQRNKNSRHQQRDDYDDDDDDELLDPHNFSGSAYEERVKAFPGVQMKSDTMIGNVDRIGLPKGATREVGKGYEEIFIPPAQRKPLIESQLVDVSKGLGQHPELLEAMKGVKSFNRLQSTVFPVAFQSDENMLVCAPTGAGKTNVALLTIFREIISVKHREKRNFKVVYVAPMKALAAEVTEKFSQRLKSLGLVVREFTGDISPTRAETLATHVLVTTPEKWDVVTRKTGSEVGESLTLFIIDEIHLLHDERGAVLESLVARTLRFSETAQRQIRLVGLSATLPNYQDVGEFLKVNPKVGLFHFDASYRPVPLSQTFIGISEGGTSNSGEARRRRDNKIHEMAWKKVKDSLQRGHQAMIFVHSRKGTSNAAREMINRATEDNVGDIFLGGRSNEDNGKSPSIGNDLEQDEESSSSVIPSWAAKEISRSKTADIRELCMRGIGIHNAGLPRPDRKLVERLFAEGVLKLLCCTATLAWGVNLPARSVIIMGTQVYNAEKGGFVQLGMLDVMQIFGRAGRPQFDTEGEGTIITLHEHLAKYLNLLTCAVPIESQLGSSASRLADHLNAEIVSGTVSSIGDGVKWLSYTYLSTRMDQNPLVYGINWSDVEADSGLHAHRASLIDLASKALDDARMCRYDRRTGMLSPLDLGRVSSYFYVSHETILLWTEQFQNFTYGTPLTDSDWKRIYSIVIHAVATATEFEQMRSRDEEAEELSYLLKRSCPIPLITEYGPETREGKVAILLQAHISRANIRMSDLSYIVQSATRLFRSLFEISLRRGMPSFSLAALELARASESRIWPFQHPLWQFTYLARRERGLLITPETIAAIEKSGQETDLTTLRTRNREELSELIRAPKIVTTVEKVLKSIPTLEVVEAKAAALNSTLLSIHVKLIATFTWSESLHGQVESWWLWIEDKEENRIYHSQKVQLTRRQVQELNNDVREGSSQVVQNKAINVHVTVAVFDPPSAQYWVRVESDRWHTGGGSTAVLTVAGIQLPHELSFHSDVSSITPSPLAVPKVTGLNDREAAWFGQHANALTVAQTAVLRTVRHADDNVLVCMPAGCGDTRMMEMAMLRAWHERPNKVVVLLSLQRGGLRKLERYWGGNSRESFCSKFGGGRGILVLGEGSNHRHEEEDLFHTDEGRELCSKYSIVLTTPKKWNEIMQTATLRNGDDETILKCVSTFIFVDLHLLADFSNIGVELLVSRMRKYRRQQLEKLRQAQSQHNGTSESSANVTTANRNEKDVSDMIPRVVSFSGVVSNPLQLGEWVGVSRKNGLFCFGDEVRSILVERYVVSVAGDRYSARMQSINRPLFSTIQRHSTNRAVVIFVSSKRQTLLTAQDLLRLASLEKKPNMFIGKASSSSGSSKYESARHLKTLADNGLKQVVPHGIGVLHENLNDAEHDAVEKLYESGHLLLLICTFKSVSKLSDRVRPHSIIVKGTEHFNPQMRKYEDLDVSSIKQMIGFVNSDTKSGYATIFVHEPKQTLFKKVLYEPLPVESSLGFDSLNHLSAGAAGAVDQSKSVLNDVLLPLVVGGKLADHVESNGVEWLKNLFVYQRLQVNPGWYGMRKSQQNRIESSGMDAASFERERKIEFCSDMVMNSVKQLEALNCIRTTTSTAPTPESASNNQNNAKSKYSKRNKKKNAATSSAKKFETNVAPTDVGRLCMQWKLGSESAGELYTGLIRLASEATVGPEHVMNVLSGSNDVAAHGSEYEEDSVWRGVFERVTAAFAEAELFKNAEVAGRDLKLNGYLESSQKRAKLLCYDVLVTRDRDSGRQRTRGTSIVPVLQRALNFLLDCSLCTDGVRPNAVRAIVTVAQSVTERKLWSTQLWNVCDMARAPTRSRATEQGWTTLDSVLRNERDFAMFLAKTCQEDERGAISRWLSEYPRLSVTGVSVECTEIATGAQTVAVVQVRLTHAEAAAVTVSVWDAADGSPTIGGVRLVLQRGYTGVLVPLRKDAKQVEAWVAPEVVIGGGSSAFSAL